MFDVVSVTVYSGLMRLIEAAGVTVQCFLHPFCLFGSDRSSVEAVGQ